MNEQFSIHQCLKILNLKENASIEEIKRAYRKLAKMYHPDIAGRDEYYIKKFREVTKAYKTVLEAIENGKIITKTEEKFSIKDFFNKKFRIKNYINIFKLKKHTISKDIKFGEVFLKRVSPEILQLPEDELIIRLEGSSNFYVMLEAIKAINKIGGKKGIISVIKNYYKYPDELKKFVVFLFKKRLNNEIFEILNLYLKKGNYETVISILGFLCELNDKEAKKVVKEFIKDNMSNLKNISLFLEALKTKIKFGLNYNELKLGEKLIFNKKISSYQLIIGLTVKEKFKNVRIGKIFLDLNFISINELKKVLKCK